jgi:hypothetical protein
MLPALPSCPLQPGRCGEPARQCDIPRNTVRPPRSDLALDGSPSSGNAPKRIHGLAGSPSYGWRTAWRRGPGSDASPTAPGDCRSARFTARAVHLSAKRSPARPRPRRVADVGEANRWPTSGGRSDRRSAESTLATQKAAAAATGLGGWVGQRHQFRERHSGTCSDSCRAGRRGWLPDRALFQKPGPLPETPAIGVVSFESRQRDVPKSQGE